MKLVLGTAQFGLPYGVANRIGQPDAGLVLEILQLAQELGVQVLDTAAAYGTSESVLGECGVSGWSVITKVSSLDGFSDQKIREKARESVFRSLDRLKIEVLHAVLAHDKRDMTGERGRRLVDALESLRTAGLVERIGVSVYAPEDMAGVDPQGSEIVQAPFNVFDQRFVVSGQAAALRARGAELHARSVFLQGLLVMAPQARPAQFRPWSADFARYDERVRDSGLDPVSFCLGFASCHADIARCVVGVESPEQLSQLVAALAAGQETAVEAADLMSHEPDLTDPRRWKAEV